MKMKILTNYNIGLGGGLLDNSRIIKGTIDNFGLRVLLQNRLRFLLAADE